MKIAVTARENGLESAVDSRFGRARYFIIYDLDSETFEAVDNVQNLNALQGAGIQAAQHVAAGGAQYVLTGHCGPKAFRALTETGIRVVLGVKGIVKDTVERFKRDDYRAADEADVEGHWV